MKIATQDSPGSSYQHSPVNNYAWGTFLDIAIKKVIPQPGTSAPIFSNAYNVAGADDTNIVFLERLLTYINKNNTDDFIDQIQILYRPNQTGNPDGLQSEENGKFLCALVQANLSTATNPAGGGGQILMRAAKDAAPISNTLNTYRDFIALLWECSIVRSGGFYLFYAVTDGNAGLPDSLFNDAAEGSVSLLITYKEEISQNFVNCAVMTDPIDTSKSMLYVESEAFTRGRSGPRAISACRRYETAAPVSARRSLSIPPARCHADDTAYWSAIQSARIYLEGNEFFLEQSGAYPVNANHNHSGDDLDPSRNSRPGRRREAVVYHSAGLWPTHARFIPSPTRFPGAGG